MDDLLSLGETLQRASAALVGDDIPDESKGDGLPVLQVVVIGASVRLQIQLAPCGSQHTARRPPSFFAWHLHPSFEVLASCWLVSTLSALLCEASALFTLEIRFRAVFMFFSVSGCGQVSSPEFSHRPCCSGEYPSDMLTHGAWGSRGPGP